VVSVNFSPTQVTKTFWWTLPVIGYAICLSVVVCPGTCQLPSHRLKTRFSHTPHLPCTHHHKQTAKHTNKHVKFVERQDQNCIFSFLTRLRVRWARNKCGADRRLSQCLLALCAGQSCVFVYRGMRRHFDVFTIYSKSCVVKACCIFNGKFLRFSFVARVSTDNPLTESTPARYGLGRTIRAHDSTDRKVMDMKFS
jgi:hypothetical protein